MKIPHGDLEVARKSPRGYLMQRGESHSYRIGAFRIWQFAVRKFHRHGESLPKALLYLERAFRRAFVPGRSLERRIAEYAKYLQDYATDFNSLKHASIELGVRISIDLGHDIILTGEVGRVDLDPNGGYSAYLLLKARVAVTNELRFPLLQHYFAQQFGVPESLVRVGAYALDTARHEALVFSTSSISKAFAEAAAIAQTLARLSRRK